MLCNFWPNFIKIWWRVFNLCHKIFLTLIPYNPGLSFFQKIKTSLSSQYQITSAKNHNNPWNGFRDLYWTDGRTDAQMHKRELIGPDCSTGDQKFTEFSVSVDYQKRISRKIFNDIVLSIVLIWHFNFWSSGFLFVSDKDVCFGIICESIFELNYMSKT